MENIANLEQNILQIKALCDKYHLMKLFAFGSVCTPNFSKKSDIDFLYEFEKMSPEEYADNYFDFLFDLKKLLKKDIDLVGQHTLKNPYLIKEIDKTKTLLYDRTSKEIIA